MIAYYMDMATGNQKEIAELDKYVKSIGAPDTISDVLVLVGFFLTGVGEGIKSGLGERALRAPKYGGAVKGKKAMVPVEGLGMLGLGFDMAKQMVSGATKTAISFVDSQWNNALAMMTDGMSDVPLSQLTPQFNASMRKLAMLLNQMANNPQSREELKSLANALGQTGVEIVEIAQPPLARIIEKSMTTAGNVGSIAARRGITAGIQILKSGISVIPGVNVAVFGAMTVISAVAGAVRIAYQLTQNATAVSSIALGGFNSILEALQKAQGTIAAAANKTIAENAISGAKVSVPKVEDLRPEDVAKLSPMQSVSALKRLGTKTGGRGKTRRGRARSVLRRLNRTMQRYKKTINK